MADIEKELDYNVPFMKKQWYIKTYDN
jgi:hypothetical protein